MRNALHWLESWAWGFKVRASVAITCACVSSIPASAHSELCSRRRFTSWMCEFCIRRSTKQRFSSLGPWVPMWQKSLDFSLKCSHINVQFDGFWNSLDRVWWRLETSPPNVCEDCVCVVGLITVIYRQWLSGQRHCWVQWGIDRVLLLSVYFIPEGIKQQRKVMRK